LPGSAHADADTPLVVADNHQSPEAKTPATFDHLGGSRDVYDALVKFVAFVLAPSSPSATILSTAHHPSLSYSSQSYKLHPRSLEIQTCLAHSVGQAFDPAMILVPAPVKDDVCDPRCLRSLGQYLSYDGRLSALIFVAQFGSNLSIQRGGRDQRVASCVVNDLRPNVFQAAKHTQPRAL
jgi:hypothetical protein